MTFYKAVRIINGKYYSWATSTGSLNYYQEKKFRLEYKLNEWTFPSLGKLFVFDQEHSAIDLDRHYNCRDKAIFECEILGEPDIKEKIPYITSIEDFWNNEELDWNRLFEAPQNTLLVEAIKPTKLIYLKGQYV